MADNISITQGSGTTIATESVAGVQHQLVKIEFGALDAGCTPVSTTNPLPVIQQNAEKAEDAAHTTGDKGIMSLGVRNTTCTDLSANNADGDYEPVQVNAQGALYVQAQGGTTGGLTFIKKISLLNVAFAVKASAGTLYGMIISNAAASARFLKLFNVASGGVTPGTTVPDMTIGIQANQSINMEFPLGINFATALTAIATNLVADADNTAPTANDITITFLIK